MATATEYEEFKKERVNVTDENIIVTGTTQ